MNTQPETLTILMLGGAKRLTMARHLMRAVSSRGLKPRLLSYELSTEEPIAEVAEVIIGRRWDEPSLPGHLAEVIKAYGVDIIIPFVDGAIEPAATVAAACEGLFCPCCPPSLSASLFDKIISARLFEDAGLAIPATYHPGAQAVFPLIAKPRRGSASKGIIVIPDQSALDRIPSPDDYLIQEYISGAEEYTVDCYIDRAGGIMTISPRRRLTTLGGEVTRTLTLDRPDLVESAREAITRLSLRGAVTLQYLSSPRGPLLMEINPRLGGGATATIAAGADIAAMIVDEALRRAPEPASPRPGVLTARCFHDVTFPRPAEDTLPHPAHTIIIAEAGVNHNGSIERAREMVVAAARAGADYVKFQTAVPDLVISSIAPKAEYQKETTGAGESQLEMCRAIHLPLTDYAELAGLCREHGIGFMSTPFDLVSIDCLAPLGMDYWKIPSGEITNLPYLRKIGALGEKVILSTGMSTLDEVEQALRVLEQAGTPRSSVILLHCTTQYPTEPADVNLRAMDALASLGCGAVGYSDHTRGITIPIAAVARGARVIEKHFTLSRALPGPDHKASLEPGELKAMVDAIRATEAALGSGIKAVAPSEAPNIVVARKSIVAARPIKAGETFTEENITVKRPGNGISPMLWDTVIGLRAPRDFPYDSLIEL